MLKRSKKWLCVLTALTIALIWLHSAMPPSLSSRESGFVFRLLFGPLAFFLGAENVTEYLVRKMAHFIEYAVLGGVLSSVGQGPRFCRRVLRRLNLGLLVAFLDETIQIFSGRGARIADVWLDISGVLAAVLAAEGIFRIRGRARRRGARGAPGARGLPGTLMMLFIIV